MENVLLINLKRNSFMLKCVSIKRWWDQRFLGLLLRVPLWIVSLLVGKWILLVQFRRGLCIFEWKWKLYLVRLQALTPLSRSELILGKTNQITFSLSRPSPLGAPRGQWSSLLSIVVEFVHRMRYFPVHSEIQSKWVNCFKLVRSVYSATFIEREF